MAKKEETKQAETPAIFMPSDLIAAAAHFNTSPEVMAGALYGVTDGLTLEDAAERLKKFITKPVTDAAAAAADGEQKGE
ncbi:hypothetical protein [Paenibacillus sp. MMO-177]|uniref:hypothetical protein n=1 Tax=Paenibacillus sp. MMO-177 TaxID=3081289 RepID=UPI003015C130